MNFQIFLKKSAGTLFAAASVFAVAAFAQEKPKQTVVGAASLMQRPMSVVAGNNLYCAGYVQTEAVNTSNRIVGANEEADRFNYGQNNYMYISMGADKGVHVGDMFSVIRPRGEVNTRWTKKGSLGFYVQEVGALEVVEVKPEVSVARVKTSCDAFLLGDLVQPTEARTSPMFQRRSALDLFGEPSGKASGRIFMARDNREMLARDQIVYVDLGREDNVQVGDYLTVYRRLGTGNVHEYDQPESVSARDYGFESFKYKGGKFSNQAARKSGDKAGGKVVTTEEAKEGRPKILRKVVGEAMVVNVKERTATVVITRNAQEIHTGDWVEVQ